LGWGLGGGGAVGGGEASEGSGGSDGGFVFAAAELGGLEVGGDGRAGVVEGVLVEDVGAGADGLLEGRGGEEAVAEEDGFVEAAEVGGFLAGPAVECEGGDAGAAGGGDEGDVGVEEVLGDEVIGWEGGLVGWVVGWVVGLEFGVEFGLEFGLGVDVAGGGRIGRGGAGVEGAVEVGGLGGFADHAGMIGGSGGGSSGEGGRGTNLRTRVVLGARLGRGARAGVALLAWAGWRARGSGLLRCPEGRFTTETPPAPPCPRRASPTAVDAVRWEFRSAAPQPGYCSRRSHPSGADLSSTNS
jgi:hypothetical protein